MPITPEALTYSCPKCHWAKTVAPRGDALMPADAPPEACPVCRNNDLKQSKAGVLASVFATLRSGF